LLKPFRIRPGLFRGLLTLVADNPAPGELAVANADTLTATYYDASRGSNIVVNATIDTVPPVITNVAAVTGYGGATVSWDTSKPADSLVQYGESFLLWRTAYSGAPATVELHMMASSVVERGGWWIDDLEVFYGSDCASGLLFADDFETGATDAWSGVVP